MRLIIALMLGVIFSVAHVTAFAEEQSKIAKRVDALLQKMTLTEKIGQMNQYNGFWDATGPVPEQGDAKTKYEHLQQGRVGSILNVAGHEALREFQDVAVKQSRLGIPLIFGFDVIHGHNTAFPIPLAEAASWDLTAIEQGARIAATEAAAQGVNWTFAPMVDISRDARWGRVAEGAGEDPYLGAEIAKARVKGFQGDDLAAVDTIAACAKHFAGYGYAEGGRDYNHADMSYSTLYNEVLPPFKAAVEVGVRTFMNSFNTLNGVPATGSIMLQRDILKGEWGFGGFVVSDWASIMEMTKHGYATDDRHASQLAVIAGSDMDMQSFAYVNHLEDLVTAGAVDESLIDDAVRRILTVKFELGLFDDPYRYINKKREEEVLRNKTHLKAAREMAKRSIVLLKNETNLLPLSKKQKNILVVGPLANDKNSPLGTWRLAVKDDSAISLVEGLQQHTSAFQYTQGVKLSIGKETFADPIVVNTTDRSGIAEAKALAKNAEVVVMMLGEHGYQSGEGRSRTDLGFPGLQQELLEEIVAVNKNIILLVASGRPLVLSWADAHIPTIVQTWQLGSESGHAIADVLFGGYNPSGKLPMSFPRSVGQVPISYRVFSTGRPEPEEKVFWSRYMDEKNSPLYPFGHGLSYTTFGYTNMQAEVRDKASIRVSITVKNTGKRQGEEVVQVYIRDKVASLVRPVKELKSFKKILLKPGKSKKVEFVLDKDSLSFYKDDGKFVFEPGDFEVMVGGSSGSVLTKTVSL